MKKKLMNASIAKEIKTLLDFVSSSTDLPLSATETQLYLLQVSWASWRSTKIHIIMDSMQKHTNISQHFHYHLRFGRPSANRRESVV